MPNATAARPSWWQNFTHDSGLGPSDAEAYAMLQYQTCNTTTVARCLSRTHFDPGLGALLHSIRQFDRVRPVVVLVALFGPHVQPSWGKSTYSNDEICSAPQCEFLRERFGPLSFRRIAALSAANASSRACKKSTLVDEALHVTSPRSAMLSKIAVWTMHGTSFYTSIHMSGRRSYPHETAVRTRARVAQSVAYMGYHIHKRTYSLRHAVFVSCTNDRTTPCKPVMMVTH